MKDTQRTSALRIRLTKSEHEIISEIAATQGIGICTFARIVVLRETAIADERMKRRKPTQAQRTVSECLAHLAKIGNNVNQIARALNSGWDCDPNDLKTVRAELQKLRTAILTATAADSVE